MQISKWMFVEAAIAAALGVAIAALVAPHGLGLGTLFPHPIWLGVLVVAARYGGHGLVAVVPMAWGALTLAGLAAHVPPGVVLARLSSGGDLTALIAAVLVGWISSTHERRLVRVTGDFGALKQRCAADQAALSELRRTAVALRARADRLEMSLTFLRDVAQKLDGADVDAAAQAALDLAMARVGARAAVVQIVGSRGMTPLASAGVWAPDGSSGSGAGTDRTAAAALATRRPTRAVDLPEGGPGDSDLAAPIVDAGGRILGVLAVRGVPHGGASAAALRDVAIIAEWSGRSLVAAQPERDATAEVAAVALEAETEPAAAVRDGELPSDAVPFSPVGPIIDTDVVDAVAAPLDRTLTPDAPARSISQLNA